MLVSQDPAVFALRTESKTGMGLNWYWDDLVTSAAISASSLSPPATVWGRIVQDLGLFAEFGNFFPLSVFENPGPL